MRSASMRPRIIKETHSGNARGKPVIVTRRKAGSVVLLSLVGYESMRETAVSVR